MFRIFYLKNLSLTALENQLLKAVLMSVVVATGSMMSGCDIEGLVSPNPFSSRDTMQIKFTRAQRSRWQTLVDTVGNIVLCTTIECSVYEE